MNRSDAMWGEGEVADIQSFASIPSLVTHLERIIALAVELDVPTPIADTLIEVLQGQLNIPVLPIGSARPKLTS